MHNIGSREFFLALGLGLLHSLFSLFIIISTIWLCLALWIQQPMGWLTSRILIGIWIAFALSVLGFYLSGHIFSRRTDILIYVIAFVAALGWYFSIEARQDRDWNPEVEKIFSYERHGDQISIHNVRNFNWHLDGTYDEHWETRQYNLNQITGVNIIASYWMGPQIAHTLVSFDFKNQRPLVFSIEIRKEKGEEFSAIGGFFRQYELSLIASDEKDIVYTRSNIRREQVYFFPVRMPPEERKALFLEYLKTADQLREHPKWYNTVTSNCTTLVFDMVRAIIPQKLPKDYRLLVSGYLPNYLYDLGALDPSYDLKTWYQMAHINPRTSNFTDLSDQTSTNFSTIVRQGLPQNFSTLE